MLQAAAGGLAADARADGLADLSGAGLAADGTRGSSAADAKGLAGGSRVNDVEHRAAKLGNSGGGAAAIASNADSAELLSGSGVASGSETGSSRRADAMRPGSVVPVQKASAAGSQQELGALDA